MNAVASRNVKFISHSDQGGRGDGVQIMVHRGFAYIGHGYSNGISVLDVRDPKNPRSVAFLPCPPDTRAIHLQTHEDLLLAVNSPSMWTMQVDAQAYYSGSPADLLNGRQYTAGIRIFGCRKSFPTETLEMRKGEESRHFQMSKAIFMDEGRLKSLAIASLA
jgi:hypothetical protein